MSLLKEIKQDKTEKVLELLQGNPDVNVVDQKTGSTPLHLAINNLNITILKCLLNLKPELNIINEEGDTPLTLAVSQGFEEGVDALIKAGVDVNFPSEDEITALHTAAEGNLREITKMLLRAGADPNLCDIEGTPLHIAAAEGADEVAFLLMEHPKIDLTVPDTNENTFLHVAIQAGAANIVKKFFENYDNNIYKDFDMKEFINHKNYKGNTVLHDAESAKRGVIAQFLRDHAKQYGLQVNVKNKEGKTADDYVADFKKKEQLEAEQKEKNKAQNQEAKKQRKEEREQLQEDRRKKQEEDQKKEIEEHEKAKEDFKKKSKQSTWIFIFLFAAAVYLMYWALENKIKEKSENILDL